MLWRELWLTRSAQTKRLYSGTVHHRCVLTHDACIVSEDDNSMPPLPVTVRCNSPAADIAVAVAVIYFRLAAETCGLALMVTAEREDPDEPWCQTVGPKGELLLQTVQAKVLSLYKGRYADHADLLIQQTYSNTSRLFQRAAEAILTGSLWYEIVRLINELIESGYADYALTMIS